MIALLCMIVVVACTSFIVMGSVYLFFIEVILGMDTMDTKTSSSDDVFMDE